jgi:DNA-binding YbaB/EbfC family protein
VSLEGMPDLGELVAKVQELQEHIAQAQAAAAAEIVEGSAGDGAVLVRMTGSLDALGVSIDPRVVDSAEVDLLEDLVLAAVRDATARARALGQDALGDLGIDPGLTGLLG